MNRASPSQQRKALEIANLFVKMGVGFVPVPVASAEEFEQLATQSIEKMSQIAGALDDSPVGGKTDRRRAADSCETPQGKQN